MRKYKNIAGQHVIYRLIYIFLVWLTTSLFLNSYSGLLLPIVPQSNFYREFLICGGQIFFQSITILIIGEQNQLPAYLVNMMTVSLVGTFLLVPALVVGTLGWIATPYFYLVYFLLVVGVMLLVHWRRVKLLELHWSLTPSWLLYRLLVLVVIL